MTKEVLASRLGDILWLECSTSLREKFNKYADKKQLPINMEDWLTKTLRLALKELKAAHASSSKKR